MCATGAKVSVGPTNIFLYFSLLFTNVAACRFYFSLLLYFVNIAAIFFNVLPYILSE